MRHCVRQFCGYNSSCKLFHDHQLQNFALALKTFEEGIFIFAMEKAQQKQQPPHLVVLSKYKSPYGHNLFCRCEEHGQWQVASEIIDTSLTLLELMSDKRFTTNFCERCKTTGTRPHYRLTRCRHVLCEDCIPYVLEHHNCPTPSLQCPGAILDLPKGTPLQWTSRPVTFLDILMAALPWRNRPGF